jgi:hypothetical protein
MDEENYEESEIELLRGILSEVQDLNTQLARTDQRSQQNESKVESLREDRIVPLEGDVITNSNRSRRNSLVLGAAVTIATILIGAATTYAFTLL